MLKRKCLNGICSKITMLRKIFKKVLLIILKGYRDLQRDIVAIHHREYECDYSWSRMATPLASSYF